MAKLAKNKTTAQSVGEGSKIENVMLPPSLPGLQKNGNMEQMLSSDGPDPASNKKRKRRRARKSGGGVASSFSEQSESNVVPESSLQISSSRPQRPTLESLTRNLTQEERTVYEQEPEMFGVYAGASSDEEVQLKKKPKKEKSEAYGADLVPVTAAQVQHAAPAGQNTQAQLRVPSRMIDGKYPCPFKDESDCAKTFTTSNNAIRHGEMHTNANKFKCLHCNRGFSRKDTYDRHVSSHQKGGTREQKSKSSQSVAMKTVADGVHTEPNNSTSMIDQVPATPEPDELGQQTSIESESETGDEVRSRDTASNTTLSIEEVVPQRSKVKQAHKVSSAPGDEASENIVEQEEVNQPVNESLESDVDQQKSSKRKRSSVGEHLKKTARQAPRKRPRTATPTEDSAGRTNKIQISAANAGHEKQKVQRDGTENDSNTKIHKIADQVEIREETDEYSASDIDQSSSKLVHRNGKAPAEKPQREINHSVPDVRRQSSMDSFVSRERAPAASAKASSSRSRSEVINRPTQKQTQLGPGTKSAKAVPVRGKGKERAISSDGESPHHQNTLIHKSQSKPTTNGIRNSQRSIQLQQDDGSDSDSDGIGKPAKKLSKRARTGTADYKEGETGRFTEHETTTLYSWRESFCTEHDISTTEFNNMMTASMRREKFSWPYKYIDKKQFLQQFYDQLPNRNRRSMIRFRERHFQNVTDAKWTEQDDDELKTLVRDMGTKWVDIGQMMDRTADQVSQRWRHKLNYGHDVATGEWSKEDILNLETEVEAFAASKGKTVDDETLVIPWHAISIKIGNGRTPQQCSNRWRISTTRRIGGVFVKIGSDERDGKKSVKTPGKTARRLQGDDGRKAKKASKKSMSVSKQKLESDADNQPSSTKRKTRVKPRTPKKLSEERVADSSDEADDESEIVQRSHDAADDFRERSINDETSENENDEISDSEPTQVAEQSSDQSQVSDQSDAPGDTDPERLPSPVVPSPESRFARTQSTQGQSSQPKQSQGSAEIRSSQIATKPTPAQSKNPFSTKKSPSMSLTQLHGATQATANRDSTGKRSHVPDTVLEERPSPGNSIRRRPVSSPLDMIEPHSGIEHGSVDDDSSSASDEDEGQNMREQSIGTESGDESSDNDGDRETEEHPTSSSFWTSVNRLRSILPGSSQALRAAEGRKPNVSHPKDSDSDSDD